MYKSLVVGLGFALLVASVSGCKKSSNGTTGTGGASGAAGASAAGSGAPATVDCNTITTDSSLSGNSCNNLHDKCFLTKNAEMVHEIGSKCATGGYYTPYPDCKSCVTYAATPESPDAVKCFTDCAKAEMQTLLGDVPSDACTLCSDKVVTCGAMHCLAQCIGNGLAPSCTACLCDRTKDALGAGTHTNCLVDVYQDCLGYKVPDALVGCGAVTGTGGSTGSGGTTATMDDANKTMCLAKLTAATGSGGGGAGSAGGAGTAGGAGAAGGAGTAGGAGAAGGAGTAGGAGGAAAGGAGAAGSTGTAGR